MAVTPDEQLVRDAWINVRRDQNPYMGHNWRILADHPTMRAAWVLSGNSNCTFERSHHLTEAAAWAAAANVTRRRLREIGELKEEIEIMHRDEWTARYQPVRQRILARLDAELRELRRGMEGPWNNPTDTP